MDADSNSRKLVMITGASDGIGLEAAVALVKDHECDVILACRSRTKATKAMNRIQDEWSLSKKGKRKHSMPRIEIVDLDTSKHQSTRECIKQLTQTLSGRKLDVLINNAGVGGRFPERNAEMTEDRIEPVFAINYLSHDLLTRLIIKNGLIKLGGPDTRIINVTSVVHHNAHHDFRQFCRSDPSNTGYARSKLAQLVSTFEYARRQMRNQPLCGQSLLDPQPSRIKFLGVHPGAIRSNIWRNDLNAVSQNTSMSKVQKLVEYLIHNMIQWIFLPPKTGAKSLVHAAVQRKFSFDVSGPEGAYLTPGLHEPTGLGISWFGMRQSGPDPLVCDESLGQSLWQLSNELAAD